MESKRVERTMRPDWDTFIKSCLGVYVICFCGKTLKTVEELRAHWEQGHFDYNIANLEPATRPEEEK